MSEPNSIYIALSSLVGEDQEEVLRDTLLIQPPVPPKGSREYKAFLKRFSQSPANIMTSIMEFVRRNSGWNPASEENFSRYLADLASVPIFLGFSSNDQSVRIQEDNLDDVLKKVYNSANVPGEAQAFVETDFLIRRNLTAAEPKAETPLNIITLNLNSSSGNMELTITEYRVTVKQVPMMGMKVGYVIAGNRTVSTATTIDGAAFEKVAQQFLDIGLSNVVSWERDASTPAPVLTIPQLQLTA